MEDHLITPTSKRVSQVKQDNVRELNAQSFRFHLFHGWFFVVIVWFCDPVNLLSREYHHTDHIYASQALRIIIARRKLIRNRSLVHGRFKNFTNLPVCFQRRRMGYIFNCEVKLQRLRPLGVAWRGSEQDLYALNLQCIKY